MMREPLFHFIVLGGLVFAADQWRVSQREDPNVIVVPAKLDERSRAIFRNTQGREPTDAELGLMREDWLETEVLYREGLALKLEQGDRELRERVATKAKMIVESGVRVPEPDEPALRAFFEQRRAVYDTPPNFDFSEAVPREPVDEQGARALADALNRGDGDVSPFVRLYEKHPRPSLVASFGPAFADALDRVALGEFQVIPSSAGSVIVRVESRDSGRTATFDAVRARVRKDWMEAKARELRKAAVRELAQNYVVQAEGGGGS